MRLTTDGIIIEVTSAMVPDPIDRERTARWIDECVFLVYGPITADSLERELRRHPHPLAYCHVLPHGKRYLKVLTETGRVLATVHRDTPRTEPKPKPETPLLLCLIDALEPFAHQGPGHPIGSKDIARAKAAYERAVRP